MNSIEEIDSFVLALEKRHFTKEEIIEKLRLLIQQEEDHEEMVYRVNNVLYFHGYSCNFVYPQKPRVYFNNQTYVSKIKNATKSKQKTIELIEYLKTIQDYRLTLASCYKLKLKMLIDAQILNEYSDFIKEHEMMTFYDFYFTYYDSEDRKYLDNILDKLGFIDIEYNYMQFKMHMEHLLWSITLHDKSKEVYKKINSIKIALNICPKEYFIYDDKHYYNEEIKENLSKYLKLMDADMILKLKEMQKHYDMNDLADDGYKLLYNML